MASPGDRVLICCKLSPTFGVIPQVNSARLISRVLQGSKATSHLLKTLNVEGEVRLHWRGAHTGSILTFLEGPEQQHNSTQQRTSAAQTAVHAD